MHFRSAKFLRNPHLQTILPLLISQKKFSFIRDDFYFDDGDFTEIVWSENPENKTFKHVSILFHGLGGSIRSHYIQGMMYKLMQAGHLCVLMHFRGCGMKTNAAKRSYHAGETEDASDFIAFLQKKFPHAKLHAVGYSLGANMLLKLLGTYKTDSPLSSAVAISAPLELEPCTIHLSKGFAKVYQRYLLKSLKDNLLVKSQNYDLISEWGLSTKVIKDIKSIYEFDELYTAPVHGFKDANDYYTKNSSRQYLKDIATPTLMVHALDDPFMPNSVLPLKDELSESITLELSEHGGHVGFIEGSLLKPNFWLEKRVLDFF